MFRHKYRNKKTGTLTKKGRDDLNDRFKNKQKFRDEIINFFGDKAGLSNEKILDKRFKHNSLNKLGMETLAGFAWSRDYTRSLIDILLSCNLELKR